MKPLTHLLQHFRDIDRRRARAFVRFLWERFLEDRCFETASAMAYTTVFAMVPLAAAVFGIISAFPVFQQWTDELTGFLFANFVPQAASAVEAYVRDSAEGASRLTSAGVIGLLAIALLLMKAIEDTFNRIWRVSVPRSSMARFLMYWAALTLGPILVVASLGLSSYLFSLPAVGAAPAPGLGERLLALLPIVLELATFTLGYMIIPNRTVAFRHALAGGVLATALFELAKFGLTVYLRQVPSYEQIYGALAVIPIFLLWVYLSWIVILLGASFAASLSAFRFQPAEARLPEGFELFGLLRLLGRFAEAQRDGVGLHTDRLRELEPSLTDDMLMRMLQSLAKIKVLQRSEDGAWVLVRDLRHLTLAELYETGRLRVPSSEAHLPCREDALGQRVLLAIDELRVPLREGLKRRVGDVLAIPADKE